MKDQFGNYVVQRVLQTCDDKYLEMILSSIKVHLNELKNYTYGKHIVARVEKLIITGGKQTSNLCIPRCGFIQQAPNIFCMVSENRVRMVSKTTCQCQKPSKCTDVDAKSV